MPTLSGGLRNNADVTSEECGGSGYCSIRPLFSKESAPGPSQGREWKHLTPRFPAQLLTMVAFILALVDQL